MKPRFLYFYHDEEGEIKGISPSVDNIEFKDFDYQKIPFDDGQPFLVGKKLLHQWYFTVKLPKVRLMEKTVNLSSVPSMYALNEVKEERNGITYITKKDDPTILFDSIDLDEELVIHEDYSYYEENVD